MELNNGKKCCQHDCEDIFTHMFYFVSDNGWTKVSYPESWNKEKERKAIIKSENKKRCNE